MCIHRKKDVLKFYGKLINIGCARRVQKSQRNGMESARDHGVTHLYDISGPKQHLGRSKYHILSTVVMITGRHRYLFKCIASLVNSDDCI